MAESPESAFLVNAYADPIVIKVNGRASYLNSAPLSDFIRRMIAEGKSNFVIDFRDCTTMDSTFLGIIAGAAIDAASANPPGTVSLHRLSTRNLELVRNLGLHRIAQVDAGDFAMDFESPGEGLSNVKQDQKENARMILNAHENLVEIDESNLAKFQDVISFMKNQIDSSG